ncbi:hypothetical protein FED26_16125, partial [Acinetobacter baumannii]|uniref:hypothetical protein n=1 Tax=Acinetobacter baumannii TaxID=470 RepID=UPI0010FE012D
LLIGFVKKEEFKEILAILRRQIPDRIRVLLNLSCTEHLKFDPFFSATLLFLASIGLVRNKFQS